MSLRNTLRDRLLTVWAGEPWYGSSSKKIFEDVTAAEAAARPLAGVHSIWEITLHMAGWTEEVTSRLQGNPAKEPPRGDWPAVSATSADAWTATTGELRAARQALLDALEKVHEEDLYMHVKKVLGVASEPEVTRAQTVAGLVEHDVYHLGQIALLKKAARTAKS